ncbi:hypothetical protein FNV43_RR02468 [Rhamnella rubrinervis]|uniref:Uncharacterized protein n=1 Tax=Rhamnella rubrinervis TaxID=2594499 RepID=A0A8K0MTS7_9ROSA|nr:hypothetical protein FNV43_RR02468 [Rhamnella rubrinervis]
MYLLMLQWPPACQGECRRGDILSTSGDGYQNIGLDEDSPRRELEGRKQDVAMFLRGEAIMIPIRGGGHYYISTRRFEQMQTDHRHEMYKWYMDQYRDNPVEQLAMTLQAVDEDPVKVAEEDSMEDPEEELMGFEDYVPFGYSLKLVDPKDFDL